MNLKELSKPVIIILAFLLVILLAITDTYVSHHPALIIFYIIPVSLVTWFAGAMAGVFIALCSVIAWLSHHNIPYIRSLYIHPVFFYINMTARGSFLFIVVYVLQRLKTAMAHEKELNELKSTFVANVSHEFKNPLGIVKESYKLILDGLTGEIKPEQREVLEVGKKTVERLIRLVTDLLDVSKIEAGKMAMRKEKIEIAPLINGILKDYERAISKKQLFLKTDIQKDIGFILVDKDKLEQVIINLLSNAIKYTPSGGSIVIKLTGTESEIQFEISDTGPGIAKKDIHKLFSKYERIIVEKKEGTGLGLSIAKSIIELHKGKIWVESKLGKGSKFIFTLPRDFKNLR